MYHLSFIRYHFLHLLCRLWAPGTTHCYLWILCSPHDALCSYKVPSGCKITSWLGRIVEQTWTYELQCSVRPIFSFHTACCGGSHAYSYGYLNLLFRICVWYSYDERHYWNIYRPLLKEYITAYYWATSTIHLVCQLGHGTESQNKFHSCEPCPSSYHHQADDSPVYIQLHDCIQPYCCKLWALVNGGELLKWLTSRRNTSHLSNVNAPRSVIDQPYHSRPNHKRK